MAKKLIIPSSTRRCLIIFLHFLVISSLTHLRFMAQGRVLVDRESLVMIGSTPPRCEMKYYCGKCGKCEAIQVPIVPSIKSLHGFSLAYSRGDAISNYKPICWKCKCGDLIFNP